jgi:hypothetical protein
MDVESVIRAINSLDLKTLSLENVELLQKMVPTEQESKLYKDYVIEKKSINLLTEEDKFMLNLTKVERISSKLSIMNYMGNFFDSLHLISPVSLSSFPSSFPRLTLSIPANLLNHLRFGIGEVVEEVPRAARSDSRLRQLPQQQQTRSSLRFPSAKSRHTPRHKVNGQEDVTAALHRRHHPPELPRPPQLRLRAVLHRQSIAGVA